MTEIAGWAVAGLDFLPPGVARRMAQEDAREAREAKEAEREKEVNREELHQRAMLQYAEQAERRGEVVTAMQLAQGNVTGRSVGDILAAAVAAGDREDAWDALRIRREGEGAPAHIEVGEPQIVSSPVKRSIASRSRHWQEWQEKRRAAENARAAVKAELDHGLIDGVVIHRDR